MGSLASGDVLVLSYGREMATLPVVRSLGRRRIRVVLSTVLADNIAAKSRYVRRIQLIPDLTRDVARCIEWIKTHIRTHQYSAVFPLFDTLILPFFHHRDEFHGSPPIIMGREGEFSLSYNKENTLRAASEQKVPFPRTKVLREESEKAHVLEFFDGKFPLILKPSFSKRSLDNRVQFLSVRRARSITELEEISCQFLKCGPVLVQEMHQGRGIGQEFLLSDGEVLAEF